MRLSRGANGSSRRKRIGFRPNPATSTSPQLSSAHRLPYRVRARLRRRERDNQNLTIGNRETAGARPQTAWLVRHGAIVVAVAALVAVTSLGEARAATWQVTSPRIVAHFDPTEHQTAEALTVEPNGSADVTLADSNQVVRVWPNGKVQTLAQLPATGKCPVLGLPITTGIVRLADGTLDVLACDGDSTTGVWSIPASGGTPVQIAQLPADTLPNGLALDSRTGYLYIADSLGAVWRVPSTGGTPVEWTTGTALQPLYFIGANGVELSGGAVWVSNSDRGAVLRIPIEPGGDAGTITTSVTGVGGADDFAVLPGNLIVLALNASSQVVIVSPGGKPTVVLTAADGIDNPTDVKFWAPFGLPLVMYVTSAAYTTTVNPDPNLLAAGFIF